MMTHRKNAERFRYAFLEEQAAPRHFRTGADVEATLSRLPNYHPIMLRTHDTRCYGCDQLIELGDTAFVAEGHPHAAPVLCYSCGVGWCIHSGSHRVEFFDDLPAIGGPVL